MSSCHQQSLSDCLCPCIRRYDSLYSWYPWTPKVWREGWPDKLCCSTLYWSTNGPKASRSVWHGQDLWRPCGEVQQWIQHGKHWWSIWYLHLIFGCRILLDLTLEIKFGGSWRVLWMEVCLSVTVPNGSLVMIQKARNSMQEYSSITSWLKPL